MFIEIGRSSLVTQMVKSLPANAGDLGSIPWLGRSPEKGIGYPFQYSWALLLAQLTKNPPAMWETWVRFLGLESVLSLSDCLTLIVLWRGFPCGSPGKESTCNVGDLGSIPGLGKSPEGGHDNPLQYSCLENPHGQRSLASYSPWGRKELDTIK